MKDLKEWLNDTVENAAKNLAENSACAFFGEKLKCQNVCVKKPRMKTHRKSNDAKSTNNGCFVEEG